MVNKQELSFIYEWLLMNYEYKTLVSFKFAKVFESRVMRYIDLNLFERMIENLSIDEIVQTKVWIIHEMETRVEYHFCDIV